MSSHGGGASNPNIKTQMTKTSSASSAVQTYVASVLQQADISLPQLENLADHQKTARKHALYWQNTVMPVLTKTITDVIDFGNEFDSLYATLLQMAEKIASGDKAAIDQLAQGLQYLASTVQDKDNNTQGVLKDLNTFYTGLNTDYQNFASDEKEASVKIAGTSGELAALAKELDAVNSAMEKDIGLMAGGGAAIGLAALAIFVGGFTEVVTGGASTALVVAGIGLALGGIGLEIAGAVDYAHEVDQLSSIKEKIQKDKQGLSALKTVKGQLDGFLNSLKGAIAATSELQKGWAGLKSLLDELIQAVKRIDPKAPPVFLKPLLEGAKKDWDDALAQAKKLLPSGQMAVPVKKVKNIQSVIHVKGA